MSDTHHSHGGSATSSTHSSTETLTQASLSAALQSFSGANRVFYAELGELNNSDARGGVLLVLRGDKLTVLTAARGVEAGQVHIQHIHGFEDGRDAVVPTLAQDADRDGFIELAEGIPTYGPILLNLNSPPGSGLAGFPTPDGTSYVLSQTYDLSDPVNGDLARLLDDVSLNRREIVLHGMSVLEGQGDGTTGEVNGTAGYKLVLPIASGEIRELSYSSAVSALLAAAQVKLGRTLTGGDGDDVLVGGRGSERLFGNDGDDRLIGGRGDDYLDGGAGRDSLSGQQGDDYLSGGSGRDRLNGGSGDDRLSGGSSADVLIGGSGDDHLNGGSAGDQLTGGSGHDHINGGSGADTVFFDVSRDGNDVVDLGTGFDFARVTASGSGQVRLTFTSAEVGNGSAKDAGTLTNQDGKLAVRLQAENGADGLVGPVSRFDDEGITFLADRGGLTFDVRDLVSGVARGDQFKAVVLGTSGNDVLTAPQARSSTYFNTGAGDDTVTGSSRADFLVGGGGNDQLNGSGGNDRFIAGGGNDILTGGSGNDVFIFNAALTAANVDTIRDFGRGDDVFQLDDAVFMGLTVGALSEGAFAFAASAGEADDRVIYDQANGNLFFDADGGARDNAQLFATLSNRAPVTAADFIVI